MTEGSTDTPIPVVVMGLGFVGQAIARAALARPELSVVAAVDPAHAGRRLDALLGVTGPGLPIVAEPGKALALAKGGVVLHATGSSLSEVAPQLRAAIRAGVSVVSTCEELAYPWFAQPDLADELADLCDAHDVAMVGAGVNPGFVLDRLPAFLLHVTGPVRHVHAMRVQDAAPRRPALHRKIGAGLTEAEFSEAERRREVGHVGLAESALLVADGCGFDLDEVDLEEEIEPVVAEEDLGGPLPIRAGRVAGVRPSARAFVGGTERVRLDLEVHAGAAEPRDEVRIDGPLPLTVRVDGGIPGDEATAWTVVNAAPAMPRLRGLVTVLELPAGR